jgi:uncharacterized membrane protein YfcA
MELVQLVVLLLLGLVAGTYGAIIGAGGGFVVVPILLLIPWYQDLSPQTVTGISLMVVFCSAVSASQAFLRQRRVDIPIACVFAVAAIPGSVLGRLVVGSMNRGPFEIAFGILLIVLSAYLAFRKPPVPKVAPTGNLPFGVVRRTFTLQNGEKVETAVDLRIGAVLSLGVGFLAALFGIGGGLLLVPIMVGLLTFPPHFATATSQFFLMLTSLVAVFSDILTQPSILLNNWPVALLIAIGVIAGAQIGARLSRKMAGPLIVRLLALALVIVGVRLVLSGLSR